MDIVIRPATEPQAFAEVARLFREYADFLGIDLGFQGFERELAGLPGKYAPPQGGLWLAWASKAPDEGTQDDPLPPLGRPGSQNGQRAIGCVALRPLEAPDIAELKRLYVSPEGRGHDLGRRLSACALEAARAAGYRRVRLDSLPRLQAAIHLYEGMGFRDIPAYYHNPEPGVRFMELDLAAG